MQIEETVEQKSMSVMKHLLAETDFSVKKIGFGGLQPAVLVLLLIGIAALDMHQAALQSKVGNAFALQPFDDPISFLHDRRE